MSPVYPFVLKDEMGKGYGMPGARGRFRGRSAHPWHFQQSEVIIFCQCSLNKFMRHIILLKSGSCRDRPAPPMWDRRTRGSYPFLLKDEMGRLTPPRWTYSSSYGISNDETDVKWSRLAERKVNASRKDATFAKKNRSTKRPKNIISHRDTESTERDTIHGRHGWLAALAYCKIRPAVQWRGALPKGHNAPLYAIRASKLSAAT